MNSIWQKYWLQRACHFSRSVCAYCTREGENDEPARGRTPSYDSRPQPHPVGPCPSARPPAGSLSWACAFRIRSESQLLSTRSSISSLTVQRSSRKTHTWETRRPLTLFVVGCQCSPAGVFLGLHVYGVHQILESYPQPQSGVRGWVDSYVATISYFGDSNVRPGGWVGTPWLPCSVSARLEPRDCGDYGVDLSLSAFSGMLWVRC